MIDISRTNTIVIGAGPFGLSIAAHLRPAAAPFRIFGFPMDRWLERMPRGMFLKSEGEASSLSEPGQHFTLPRFCADNRIPYGDRGRPVAIDTFTRYALAFQRRFVPEVEQVRVSNVSRFADEFHADLEDGRQVRARNVIVATGLEHTVYVPPVFAHLPSRQVSHSSAHSELSAFRGRDVTVVGAGQSAIETAALLRESDADVRLIARTKSLEWNCPPREGTPGLYRRLRYPTSNLGEGIQLSLYSDFPNLFRYLPMGTRISRVNRILGPAGAWWLRDRVEGRVVVQTGSEVTLAESSGDKVRLCVRGASGVSEILTDHVIAATGYRYDLQNLSFLSEHLRRTIRTQGSRPDLSPNFETNIPGLYFAGMASAYRFGPAMRFIEGVHFTARTLTAYLAAQRSFPLVVSARVASASR
jgi:thioredoxin reductase